VPLKFAIAARLWREDVLQCLASETLKFELLLVDVTWEDVCFAQMLFTRFQLLMLGVHALQPSS
jgi:hypothetical protein